MSGVERKSKKEKHILKSVIIIIVDALRFDCLTYSQDKRFLRKYNVEQLLYTPNLDWVAEQGVFFEQARSTATYTPIAVASLFTGCYPPKHGVRSFYDGPIPSSLPTIWELFSMAGCDTIFYRDNMLNPQQEDGLGDFMWDWNGCTRGCHHRVTVSSDDLFKTLRDVVNRPFLLVAHFFDIHAPYLAAAYLFDRSERRFFDYINTWSEKFGVSPSFDDSSEPEFEELATAFRTFQDPFFSKGFGNPVESLLPMYVEGVSKFDQGHFAYFLNGLRQLNLLDNALTVILSDHGEAEYSIPGTDRRSFNHGCLPVEGAIRIPLIFYSPRDLSCGKRISTQVSIIDVLPTVLDFANVDSKDSIQGTSLLPLIKGRKALGSPGYSEHSWYSFSKLTRQEFRQQSIREGRLVGHESFVVERSLHNGKFKYVEKGDELSEEDWSADDSWFFRALFRKMLGKWENERDLLHFASQFGMTADDRPYYQLLGRFSRLISRTLRKVYGKRVSLSGFDRIVKWFGRKQIPRQKVVDCFEQHARLGNKYQLYNTIQDPEQQVNLLALDPVQYAPVVQGLKDKMMEISRSRVETRQEQMEYTDKDMEHVLAHLEHLGYL
jgi:arylsulfatase A-like enzyme